MKFLCSKGCVEVFFGVLEWLFVIFLDFDLKLFDVFFLLVGEEIDVVFVWCNGVEVFC